MAESDNMTTELVTASVTGLVNQTTLSIPDHLNNEIAKWINGFIIILGLITNSLILAVLFRSRIGSVTTSIILIFLAATDLLIMFVELFVHYIPYYWKWFPIFYSDTGCAIAFMSQATIITTSSWYIMLMTLERFIVVWFPMKARIICTQRKVTAACILMPILSVAFYSMLLNDIGAVIDNGYTQCAPKAEVKSDSRVTFKVKLQLWIAAYFFLPAIIIVVFNTAIVIRLHGAARIQRKLTMTQNTSAKSQLTRTNSTVAIKKATTLVIVASVAFVILMIPRGVSTTISLDASWTYTDTSYRILDTVAYLLQYMNHATNFFIYVLANNKFRKELLKLMCGNKRLGYTHQGLLSEAEAATHMTYIMTNTHRRRSSVTVNHKEEHS